MGHAHTLCRPCPHLTQASKVRLGQVLHLRVMNGFGGWALFMTRVTSKQAFCTRQRAVGALLWPSCPQREGLELLIGQGVEKPTLRSQACVTHMGSDCQCGEAVGDVRAWWARRVHPVPKLR